MQFLIPDICTPNQYVHDLACALEELGHKVLWNSDNLFYSQYEFDVIASQWPEGYFRTHRSMGGIKNLKLHHLQDLEKKLKQARKKTLIIAFVHNAKPRPSGNQKLDEILNKLFQINYDTAHAFVHLSKQSISEIKSHYPEHIYKDKPSLIISQGLHEQLRLSYPCLKNQIEPIDSPEAFRIFVPGAIRYWSELTVLIRAFLEARIPNKQLVIAGKGHIVVGRHPVKLLRRTAIRSIPGVFLFARRLNDEMLCREIIAADILVSPRLSATNSAIPYLAATFSKRCIGPNVGNLPDALKELNGIVFEPENPSSLARAMETAYNQKNFCFVPEPPCPSWREIAQQLEQFIMMLQHQNLVKETSLN